MALTIFEQMVSNRITTLSSNDLKGATIIGKYAFYMSTLENIEIPEGVTSIGERAFYNCNSLKNVIFPSTVTMIGDYAFQSTTALSSIILPINLIIISEGAFSGALLESITIPNKVTTIGIKAFSACISLKTVTISSSVEEIDSLAFSNTTGSMAIETAIFEQPTNMNVTLPTAGSSTGMFYVKTARSMNVYTDNLIIKNYAWSTDNITATLYHLDGTPWE